MNPSVKTRHMMHHVNETMAFGGCMKSEFADFQAPYTLSDMADDPAPGARHEVLTFPFSLFT